MTTKNRLNFIEHCRKRPDTYIGSIVSGYEYQLVYNDKLELISYKKIYYNPGLERIFIEILSNAIDNKYRSDKKDISMKSINISITDDGEITVYNDGDYIPTVKEKFEYIDPITQKKQTDELYPSELYFGYMLSGTNFEDDTNRKTSGKNGIGGKATNILSEYFRVETYDPSSNKIFYQSYEDGMKIRHKPEISSCKNKKGYTKITFLPDYKYFKYDIKKNYKDLVSLIKKHCIDASMITGCNVTFNDESFSIKSLESYTKYYFKENKRISFNAKDSINECVLVELEDEKDDCMYISFINGINTKRNGVHVDSWRDNIFSSLTKAFNKQNSKNKREAKKDGLSIKTTAKEIRSYFALFVKCEIETTPQFDSQTKEKLTNPIIPISKITDDEISKILKWSFVKKLEEKLLNKQSNIISNKKVGKNISLGKKASDANWAGKKGKESCTLAVVEGLSAMSFAYAALGGNRDRYGVLSLKGKFINIDKANIMKKLNNTELNLIKKMIGLNNGVDYSRKENYDSLRYRDGILLMTDQDEDGIHIRGLLLNFFYKEFPQLCKMNFIKCFSTPLIKVSLSKTKDDLLFYFHDDFDKWKESNTNLNLKIDYYKGLGKWKNKDAQNTFKNPKIIEYIFDLSTDEKKAINIAFSPDFVAERKKWLLKDTKQTLQLIYEGKLTITDFIFKDLLTYERQSLRRALPGIDGLKESQRKALFGLIKLNIKKTVKIENIGSRITDITAYHHGNDSMYNTISKMAQGFAGTNNIPLFEAGGQAGSRISKEAAKPRYLETMLDPIARIIYNEKDDNILSYRFEDDMNIEPEYFIPILPILLINGSYGISTGFSTNIPCYNPLEIVEWIKSWLDDDKYSKNIYPWYRGFKGTYEYEDERVVMKGILKKCDKYYEILELPINTEILKFKEYLEQLSGCITNLKKNKTKPKKEKKQVKYIKKFEWCSQKDINNVHFKIYPVEDFEPSISNEGQFMCLQQNINFSNMCFLDPFDKPHYFDNVVEFLKLFCSIRLQKYNDRKYYLINKYNSELLINENKMMFIKYIIDGKLILYKPNDDEKRLQNDMISLKLDKINESYSYLLNMNIKSCTKKKVDELNNQINNIKSTLKILQNKTIKEFWLDDLLEFEKEYPKFLKRRESTDL